MTAQPPDEAGRVSDESWRRLPWFQFDHIRDQHELNKQHGMKHNGFKDMDVALERVTNLEGELLAARAEIAEQAEVHKLAQKYLRDRDSLRQQLTALTGERERLVGEKEMESSWLIESGEGAYTRYFAPAHRQRKTPTEGLMNKWEWESPDPNDALRFVRKKDADAVIAIFGKLNTTYFQGLPAIATEHIWIAPALPPQPTPATSDGALYALASQPLPKVIVDAVEAGAKEIQMESRLLDAGERE